MEKKSNSNIKKYYFLCFITILCVFFFLIFPILNLFDKDTQINLIASIGNSLIISIIIITFADIVILCYKKNSLFLLPFFNMTLSITLFLLMDYCFINDYMDIVYVWRYSSINQPIIYKAVAIWAGQEGSIMTWMVFNSIVLFFYRFKGQVKNTSEYDRVYILSCIIGLIILLIFLFILYTQEPFLVAEPYISPNGIGLNPVLLSPLMIWHPFFTFIAYAIFLVPFSIIIAEGLILLRKKIQKTSDKEDPSNIFLINPYQKKFFDFTLKFGWLVMTLSIAFGAYWAKTAVSWGRYWGWDPVETVSLLPWLLCTAYFHTISFRKANEKLSKINPIMIFLSVVFSTLITRGGGINSLHTFTGTQELIFWVLIIGGLLIILTLYILDDVLTHLIEDYKNTKLFLDYLSYFFLFTLVFICLLGLFIPPLTYFFALFTTIQPIYIDMNYYNTVAIIPAIGLAITLIYCSLWNQYDLKSISIVLILGIIVALFIGLLTNPVIIAIIIFFFSGIAALISIMRNLEFGKGSKYFFRLNSKNIIHLGLSLILMGVLTGRSIITDILFFSGFFLFLIGITPSIIIIFTIKNKKISDSIGKEKNN